MSDDNINIPPKPSTLHEVLQWCIFAWCLMMIYHHYPTFIHFYIKGISKIAGSGLELPLSLLSITIAILLAVLHLPLVYFKLSRIVRFILYPALILPPALLTLAVKYIDDAYAKTPEGAESAAQIETRKHERQQEIDEMDELFESIGGTKEYRAAREKELEDVRSCLSSDGRFSALEQEVKSRVHNPDAFKHIETQVGSYPDGYNMQVTFQAQNGFGATQTATIRARIATEDCTIISTSGFDPE
ncbi:MAG: hypothetical protein E2598_05545 [Sphingobium sp.]|nr:hypothetical protein [Sphingobium sp.]